MRVALRLITIVLALGFFSIWMLDGHNCDWKSFDFLGAALIACGALLAISCMPRKKF